MANFTGTGGNDIWTGGSGDETATGGGGNDSLTGGGGNDVISGGAGGDILDGGDGSDFLYTFEISPFYTRPYYGNPWTPPLLDSGSENDTVNGGAGDDRIFAGYGDNINGGDGTDGLLISFKGATSGVTVDFSQLVSGGSISVGGATIQSIEYIEWVEGSDFGDTIIMGDDSANFAPVFGNGGNDHIIGGYYTGDIHGGDGDDIIDRGDSPYGFQHFGEAGNDLLIGSYNGETLDGGEGDDELRGDGGYDTLIGGNGNDLMDAGSYGDQLSGGAGNDLMYGAGDADTIDGGAGDDTIYGDYSPLGGGNAISPSSNDDVIFGGHGADTIFGDHGNDRIWSGARDGDYGIVGLYDTGAEHDEIAGGTGDDRISVGYGDDADGGVGSDMLTLSLSGASSGVLADLSDLENGGTAIIGGGTITGFESIDVVIGSSYADRIIIGTHSQAVNVESGAGNDTITIGGSSAVVDGGAGNDRIFSGIAADLIIGGAGRDIIDYRLYASGVTVDLQAGTGAGGDTISQVESVLGSEFADTLQGDGLANTLTGNGGNDSIYGRGGNDALTGGAGNDSLYGGLGDDLYYVNDAGDTVVEAAGEGYDTVKSTISYTLGGNVERLVLAGGLAINGSGNGLANNLTGNSAANTLYGYAGEDFLIGGGGLDQLDGGEGSDTYYFASFSDYSDATITDTGSTGWDVVRYAGTTAGTLVMQADETGIEEIDLATSTGSLPNFAGTAAINVDASALGSGVIIRGNNGANILTGTAVNDNLYGNIGDDTLNGGHGHDVLDGGRGADVMNGGAGSDVYYVDSAGDSVVEAAGVGNDSVFSTISYTLGEEVENLVLLGSNNLSGTGNVLNNSLTGNSAANTLNGLGGFDNLNGGAGNDILNGGGDNDWLVGGAGRDRLTGESGADIFVFDEGDFAGLTISDCDRIMDFSQVQGDQIRLEEIDANTQLDGDQGFSFLGSDPFSGAAGELRTFQTGGNTYVQGDTNGDGVGDFMIRLEGLHALQASDFVI